MCEDWWAYKKWVQQISRIQKSESEATKDRDSGTAESTWGLERQGCKGQACQQGMLKEAQLVPGEVEQ